MRRLAILLLAGAALVLPATHAGAAAPTLTYSQATGYQIAVSGAGWSPTATVTFSLLKGGLAQSVDLRPASDGTFEVGLNHVNICGLTAYAAKDTAGESAPLHGAGVMCMQNYTPPPPGTAVLTVLHGRQVGGATAPDPALKRLVKRYFTDLNEHRYTQALNLESNCVLNFMPTPQAATTVHLPASPPGRLKTLRSIRSVHLSSVINDEVPALDGAALAGFSVKGTFVFAAPVHGVSSGSHRFVVILRPCGQRWTIDPGWLSAAPYSWL